MTHRHDLALWPGVPQLSPFVELQQSLASRVTDISPFVDQLMRFLRPLIDEIRNEDGSDVGVDIEIAVREALANAVIHGNHENPQKRVYVNCRFSVAGEVLITVRDEGQGFRTIPDPTDEANLLLTHGRGLRIMQALMDEVGFQENGTIVRMRKWLRRL